MKTLIYTLICLLLASSAFASESNNLPNFSEAKKVGRVMTFPSPKRVNWFLPIALSTVLDCSPDGTPMRSCYLRVFNNMDQGEFSGLNGLRNSEMITTFDASIVANLTQGFSGLPSELTGYAPMITDTLYSSNQDAYAYIPFRERGSAIAKLQNQYRSEGLGSFTIDLELNTEDVTTYLELTDTSSLKALISKAQSGGILPEELSEWVNRADLSRSTSSDGLDDESVKYLLFAYVSEHLLGNMKHGRIFAKSGSLNALGDSVVIEDDSEGVRIQCKAEIALKDNAQQTLSCERERL